MVGKKIFLVEGAEIALSPDSPQCRGTSLDAAGVEHDLRLADLARGADRRVALEPIGSRRVRFAGQCFLSMLAQGLLARPIGILLDEVGDLGKAAGRTGAGVIDPL